MTVQLMPQQLEAKAHLTNWKVAALFMDAGTGKTRVACELINMIPDVDLVVWVGPLQTIIATNGASVICEVDKWGGFICKNIKYIGVESIQQSDRIYLDLLSIINHANKPCVIVDESIKIKNAGSKRTKRLLKIGEMVEYKLILNGTPLSKNLLDLWSQMEFLSPRILNMNIAKFKNTFCNSTKTPKCFGIDKAHTKEYITEYENIDHLYSLIKRYIFECDLQLIITQLYSEHKYQIDDESKDKYYKLKEKYLSNVMMLWKNHNIFLEMTQKMQHSYCCTEEKFSVLENLFQEIDQAKSIIFCKYIRSREECKKRYPNALVLSYQKDSLGLNLQAYRHTIYFDKIWDLALRTQSSRRTFRTGQAHDCKYYDLTGDVGLETLIDDNIKKKVLITEYFKHQTKEEILKNL